MHGVVLFSVLPRLKDVLCDFCNNGHPDIVFILPDLRVAEIEKARDGVYLFDDSSGLREVFQFKFGDSLMEAVEAKGRVREDHLSSGEAADAQSTKDEVESNDGESETNNLELTFALPEEDPGVDFEIMYEESFLGSPSPQPASNTFEDSGVKSISDGDSLNNLKSSDEFLGGSGSLEQPYDPDQRGGSTRDSGITNVDDFDRSPPDWKKSASPMVYSCQNCEHKSFTRVMLNRHRMEKHEGSINKRRLTIANSEDWRNFSCENCSFSTKWEQALDLHLMSNHEIPGRKEDSFSKKRKRVFDSPLMRNLSIRPNFKFAKTQSEAKFLKTCFSPEPSYRRKRIKDDEAYGSAQAFKCHNCGFETFLQTSLVKHMEREHKQKYDCFDAP